MFIKNLKKASFIFMVPFFIISFNNEINAQVKYVFHNKANLKIIRKYSIPRVAKKSIQTIKSNVIKSHSTNNIKLSGVKIINNKDFKNELSNISSKIGSPTKVETTTISGVEIILGSNNYLVNNKKPNKIRKTVQNKVLRPTTKAFVKNNPPTNYINNEDLFKDSPWEEIDETTTEEIFQEDVEPLETTEEEIESIEEIDLVETTTEKLTPESTNEIIQEDVEPLETTEEEIESIEEIDLVETTTEDLTPASTNEIIQEDVEPLETTEEEIESTEETTTEGVAPESTNEIVQEEVEPLETAEEEEIESIEETDLVETTTEKLAPESTNEIVQEEVEPLETTEEEIESIEENTTDEVENLRFKVSESAKIENDLAEKAILYYTVRVKSVSNPTDGLKFLSEIKDDDAVWDEHTFHLFKDKENKNITNITIGKFVDKENAEEIMEYLKTKNITNPSIEIHENNVKSTARNVQPISKSRNTTRTAIENPVNKALKSSEEKKEVSSNKNLLDNISTKVDDSENYFSVQVGANNKISSTNIQGLNLDKEKLFFVNIEKGKYAMNYGKHEDYGSAHKIALEIHKKGLQTAFVTKYENGIRVKISKKDYLTDRTPKKTISDDINQLGYIPIGPNDKGKFIQIGSIYNWDAHNFKELYDQLERTIYYKIKENNSVIFLVGPLQESEVFIELRTIKQIISDAFIKTI
jgi:hypothetical protein